MDPNDMISGHLRGHIPGAPWSCKHLFSLNISPERLVVDACGIFSRRQYTFPRESIVELRWKRMIFYLGIQIIHLLPEWPALIFCPYRADICLDRLQRAHYVVLSE